MWIPLLFAASLALQPQTTDPTWFGPVTVRFTYEAPGNPYDAETNDVRVVFEGPTREERLAFYDGGQWLSHLVAKQPGEYTARLIVNGKPHGDQERKVTLSELDAIGRGFIRIDPQTQRFRFDNGEAYWPLGINLGWQSPGTASLTEILRRMGRSGMNWARIWACHWDNKNPFWSEAFPPETFEHMSKPVLDNWDDLVAESNRSGVYFQFVLFHHGPYSSDVNSNWGEHPWNAANGGFLQRPQDFFSDPRALRLTRNWLRYAVARWGHDPSIMAWELFNEVEWVDLAQDDGRWDLVRDWHDAMAAYLRELDSYDRLVTSSSHMEHLDTWRSMDYYQPHHYSPNPWGFTLGAKWPGDKPTFIGEIGNNDFRLELQRLAVRDSIWAGVLAGEAGAAQYWLWDAVDPLGLYDEYALAARILDSSDYAERADLKPFRASVEATGNGQLLIRPGGGWRSASKFVFELPDGISDADMAAMPSYFHSQTEANREMTPEPYRFRFTAKDPGRFEIRTTQVSTNGALLKVSLNGKEMLSEEFEGRGDSVPTEPRSLGFDYPAGTHEVVVNNVGPDWVMVSEYSFSNLAPAFEAVAIGAQDLALLRVRPRRAMAEEEAVGLTGLGLADGEYELTLVPLDRKPGRTQRVRVVGGAIDGKIVLHSADMALVIKRVKT